EAEDEAATAGEDPDQFRADESCSSRDECRCARADDHAVQSGRTPDKRPPTTPARNSYDSRTTVHAFVEPLVSSAVIRNSPVPSGQRPNEVGGSAVQANSSIPTPNGLKRCTASAAPRPKGIFVSLMAR